MKKLLTPLAIGFAVYFLLKNKGSNQTNTTGVNEMRQHLINWIMGSTTDTEQTKKNAVNAFNSMTFAEVTASFQYVLNYVQKNIALAPGSSLYNEILAISNKYNLFT